MVKSFETNAVNVLNWAAEKGILRHSTPTHQMTKTLEECAEVLRELTPHAGMDLDHEALMREYGDVLVTLIVGMDIAGIDPVVALQSAYDKISKREGRMSGGVFVKDGE